MRGVLGPGEVDQGGGDVGAERLVVLAAQLLEEEAVPVEPRAGRAHETFVAADVHAEELAVGPPGDAGGAADELPPSRARR